MEKDKVAESLKELLCDYHHYLFMTSGFMGVFKGWYMGMNLGGFMQWLKSRK